ncbi:related to tRNA dihydrouridine synthase [Sporisorium reilianum f. sp. reilianum]|uniref:tRNA-dihydrouridine(16/17) synthase [NAD(P)(+)] n=1 Tax=Sporisorium reilianum f. sp. reilianum TaxID=72559 RepID=A0A2N8U648_9BASI|nr:related to tRNA dihydrouridine synthase [Sporisorium reilianum f. sp. reilianum]
MVVNHKLPLDSLLYCAAPMVGQSDLPFRLQTVRNGATSTWTQMYLASDLNSDRDMLDTLCKSLELGKAAPENIIPDKDSPLVGQAAPQIVQLAGNDVQQLVEASRKVAPFADAIDLNLGCPQRHAEQGHYGAYLLPKQNWPLLAEIVSGLAQAVDVPITTKIRLTVPKEQTQQLAVTLARAGSSLVTLHPRFASSVRRRKGLADLDQVVHVREALQAEGLLRSADQPCGDTAVVSNGNVRCWCDIVDNLASTGASGVMVGETLLENPALFHPSISEIDRVGTSPKDMALEYLDLRDRYDHFESPLKVAKQHLQSILGSIPYTTSTGPDNIAEHHRFAASMAHIIKSMQSDADLDQFRLQHLQ